LKSEYNLDFLGITKPILERELENRLVEEIRDLLLELRYGFSFIGNQYKLKQMLMKAIISVCSKTHQI